MDRNGILRVVLLILLLFIFSEVSNASFLSKIRRLGAMKEDKGNTSVQIQVSPSPSPGPAKTLNTTTKEDNSISKFDNLASFNNHNNNDNSVDNSNNMQSVDLTSPAKDQIDSAIEKTNDETKNEGDKNDKKTNSESEVGGESCTAAAIRRCTDQKWMVACVLNFYSESRTWEILLQNSGEGNMSLDVSVPNPIDNALVEIRTHQSKKINLTVGERSEVILNAGNGECVLHLDPLGSHKNFILHLPSYDQLITPINGAYFLIITVVVFGGTFACCMFRKRRQEGGIAYQELEMAIPESGVANNVETAEGWDKDWDDNWDEENAIKSPAARHAATISANGLTSRTANKDGWENDRDG